jgi:hypothetical protein
MMEGFGSGSRGLTNIRILRIRMRIRIRNNGQFQARKSAQNSLIFLNSNMGVAALTDTVLGNEKKTGQDSCETRQTGRSQGHPPPPPKQWTLS